ncbi:MAG TPA: aminotransferase class V-fold PLP-dependent enzyme, partial [Longimicrobiales bacterium]
MASTTPSYDVQALRTREFPALADAVFMNAASFGPLPRRSLAAVDDFNDRRVHVRRFGDTDIPEAHARARAAAARLVGGAPAEIALGPNTQIGLNLAAGFVLQEFQREGRFQGRRRIVLSEGEFPANVYPWLALERAGAIVQLVPTDELGRPRAEALFDALGQGDTAVFALSAVQFATGYQADMARFGEHCRRRDILFVVDAIQALGALPLDVREAHVDILSCGGQKWLCGPWGSGFTWVRSELIPHMEPLFPGWLSFTSSQDFATLVEYGRELLPDGRRYEMATVPAQDAIGMA